MVLAAKKSCETAIFDPPTYLLLQCSDNNTQRKLRLSRPSPDLRQGQNCSLVTAARALKKKIDDHLILAESWR